MRKIITTLLLCLLTLGVIAQVSSRIKTRYGYVNQLKAYGRVLYKGLNYCPAGKDSLVVMDNGSKSDSIVIPPILTIDKKPYTVSGFKQMAFEYKQDLRYISIPSTITEIPNSCFYHCHRLSKCVMPGVETIKGYAFLSTGFERLVFHEGLRYIGDYAFNGCADLRYVEFPSTLKKIGSGAFLQCNIDTFKVHATEPIQLEKGAVSTHANDYHHRQTVLLVPKGSKALYQADKNWGHFTRIEEF